MATPVKELRLDPAPAAPVRPVRLGPRDVVVDRRADGTIHLRSPHALPPYPAKLTERLEYWAATAPERVYLAQRDAAGGWRKITYGETLDAVRRIGAALLARDLSPERPIVILSGNDIEHALIGLAAMYVGIPYAPISPAYALISQDFGKLRSHLRPAHAGSGLRRRRRAVPARHRGGRAAPALEIVVTRNPIPSRPSTLFRTLLAPTPTASADAAHAAVGPDTIAKFLFTSGSTGTPKAVINTQRMWCSNQAMILAQLAFFADEPPVIVDWSPWHHTAGGNHNFGFVLYNGGTFYIDEGKPAPGAIETTVKNLREVATNWYFTVPKGYEALLPYFRADARLREIFFSRLKVLWFAGAALSQSVFDEMQELALESLRRAHHVPDRARLDRDRADGARAHVAEQGFDQHGRAGAGRGAQAGAERRQARGAAARAQHHAGLLAPARAHGAGFRRGRLLQARRRGQVRGPRRSGSRPAVRRPHRRGLQAGDRHLGQCRPAAGALARAAGALCPRRRHRRRRPQRDRRADLPQCRRLPQAGRESALAASERPHGIYNADCGDARVLDEIRARLNAFAKTSTGSSNRVCRAILLAEPPSLDAGEMTDKGSINQRAVLSRRADLVGELYAGEPSPRVLVIDT